MEEFENKEVKAIEHQENVEAIERRLIDNQGTREDVVNPEGQTEETEVEPSWHDGQYEADTSDFVICCAA